MSKEKNITVGEIVRQYLEEHEFDGLCCDTQYHFDEPCGCSIDDLCPCDDDNVFSCRAAYKKECSSCESNTLGRCIEDHAECFTTERKGRNC